MDHKQQEEHNHYARLAVMIALSFVSMYVLMYSMVNTFGDVYNSLNQVYMAGLMTAPMVVIELLLMSGMYKNPEPHFSRSHHEYLRQDHSQRPYGTRETRGRRTPFSPAASSMA